MDFNIAAAFWFAARGVGRLYQPPIVEPSSMARGEGRTPVASCQGQRQDQGQCQDQGRGQGQGLDEALPGQFHAASALPTEITHQAESRSPRDPAGVLNAATLPVVVTEEQGQTPGAAAPQSARPRPEEVFLADGDARRARGQEGGDTRDPVEGGEEEGEGTIGRKAKVNRNSEELCPVGGCRRLLKPGCVFGVCSKCCSRAQGLLVRTDAPADAGAAPSRRPPGADAVMAGSRSPAGAPRPDSGTVAPADGEASEGSPPPAEEAGGRGAVPEARRQAQQRLCKARALARANRALEDHLLRRFGLAPPFCAQEVASVLLEVVAALPVKTGRDLHRRNPGAATLRRAEGMPCAEEARPGATTTATKSMPVKLCPVHKGLVGAGGRGGKTGRPTGVEGGSGGEEGGERGQRRSMPATAFRSEARVLLVGIGADEFMAGYSRHRNAYKRGGEPAVGAGRLCPPLAPPTALDDASRCRDREFVQGTPRLTHYARVLPVPQPKGEASFLNILSCFAVPR